jgi:hypothetical protein
MIVAVDGRAVSDPASGTAVPYSTTAAGYVTLLASKALVDRPSRRSVPSGNRDGNWV